MAKKILVVLTSYGKMSNGHPTGWYLPEFAHPYDEFKSAGYDVTVASPHGGVAPLDPGSVNAFKSDESCVKFLEHKSIWENTVKLDALVGKAADEYDALFYPGGHGPMFDLATDATSHRLIAEFVEKGKVVSAVCHGPAAFVNVKIPSTGESMLKGKTVTGFSNAEEDSVSMSQYMPFMLEDKMREASGGKYVKADEPWGPKVVVDGKLITGQNPASAKGVGEEIVKALA
ncbi:class I glutamine amidotransferase-like protein [Diplogelasinospora grovesii]|uniref:D-lactate dehydratase n=1 Tax=Diplogelasinospora grovesii TaxID=303347 RepID=A0AAN6N079_9PEZI|nr:class I glutamine amidotransferase-like protein [Diplogelasinospora grovesii]